MKRIMKCKCGSQDGKLIVRPHSHSQFGITISGYTDTGTFKDRKSLLLENNFCPQCGTKIEQIPMDLWRSMNESQ